MKTSTKILLIVNIALLIANVFLIRYLAMGIVPTENGFIFEFSALSWVALTVLVAFLITFIALYIVFLRNMRLSNLLFFSTLPLTLIYGVFVVYIAKIGDMDDITSASVKATLNLNSAQGVENLWIALATITYLVLLFVLIMVACRPLKNVEKVTQKLGDGRVKMEDYKIGGSKQFQEIEHSLNKINYLYKEKDNKLKIASLASQKYLPKQLLNFLGKNGIEEVETGKSVTKEGTILYCDLKPNKTLSLEENFNYINSYLKVVAPLIKRFDGFVDKYLGDGLIAVFSRAQNAVECAHAILKAVEDRNKNQKKSLNIASRISVHTGALTIALSAEEKTPTVVSPIINMLSKMEEINEFMGGKLLFSKKTLDSFSSKYNFDYRYLGDLEYEKSITSLFESLDCYPKRIREKLKKYKNEFENGVRFYNEKRYREAKDMFEKVLQKIPNDNASFVYFNKCNEKLSEVA
ncbi:MAG TPA: hypothetical protein IAC38_00890 [Candidatus Caccovivens faecavium]|nr:hypothetical protein [Candidatus Caccovivens faecavium]